MRSAPLSLLFLFLFFSDQGPAQSPCKGDTVLDEDFANGFSGNNGQGVSWDTAGSFGAWRACTSNCTSNGSFADPGPLQSTSASNGYVNLDLQAFPANAPPVQTLSSTPMDLSGYSSPVLFFESVFRHCCAKDHELRVLISTDGGSTWTDSVDLLPWIQRGEGSPNPSRIRIHLDPMIAANPSNVAIRFKWPPTGPDANNQISRYSNWYIDDVLIREAHRNDLALGNTSYKPRNATFAQRFGQPIRYSMIPACDSGQVPCMEFGGQICNVGSNSLNDVHLQGEATNSGGTSIGQLSSNGTALGPDACIGGALPGHQPPHPDTVPANGCFRPTDTGAYRFRYRAYSSDSADCDSSNNSLMDTIHWTERTYAIDRYASTGNVDGEILLTAQSNTEIHNIFGFEWMDGKRDTVQAISFYLTNSSEPGAGPLFAGIKKHPGTPGVIGESDPYYVIPSDIGSWVTLPITEDGQGDPIDGIPVDSIQGAQGYPTAFLSIGGDTVGIGTSGKNEYTGSWVYGNFGGGGSSAGLRANDPIPMLRVKMNCHPPLGTHNTGRSLEEPLIRNHPDPFRARTTVEYRLQKASRVQLSIRDLAGQKIRHRDLGKQDQGRHRIRIQGSGLSPGIYFYTLRSEHAKRTERMVVRSR